MQMCISQLSISLVRSICYPNAHKFYSMACTYSASMKVQLKKICSQNEKEAYHIMEKCGCGKFGEFGKSSVICQTNFFAKIFIHALLPKYLSMHFCQTLSLLKFSAIQYSICYYQEYIIYRKVPYSSMVYQK